MSLTKATYSMIEGASVNVLDYGAVGDGIANDSVAIQAAIDYVESIGGGIVYFPKGTYKCNVILKSGVTLTSFSTGTYGYLAGGSVKGVVLQQASAGFVVDTPITTATACAIVGINFQGNGAGTPGGGIRFRYVNWGAVKQCNFNGFADQAVLKELGFASTFEDILITNALLNRTRATVNGVFEIADGSDDFLSRIEANAGLLSGVSDANLRVCGIVIKGANIFVSNCVGEFSDYGFYTTGLDCRIVNSRADQNRASGFYCGGTTLYSNCLSLSNSQAAPGTYDGFQVMGQRDSFVNCYCRNDFGSIRYGFYDIANFLAVGSRNTYVNCAAKDYTIAAFYTEGYLGSSPIEPGIPARVDTAIPDTTGTTFLVLVHGSPTTITNFTGGYSGKTLRLLPANNPNVTIKNNATINTNTGADKLLDANKVYTFTNYNGVWYENA